MGYYEGNTSVTIRLTTNDNKKINIPLITDEFRSVKFDVMENSDIADCFRKIKTINDFAALVSDIYGKGYDNDFLAGLKSKNLTIDDFKTIKIEEKIESEYGETICCDITLDLSENSVEIAKTWDSEENYASEFDVIYLKGFDSPLDKEVIEKYNLVGKNAPTEKGKIGDDVYYFYCESSGLVIIYGTGEMWCLVEDWKAYGYFDEYKINEVIIDSGVTSICCNLIYDSVDFIRSVTISGTVKTIENAALDNYIIKKIVAPKGSEAEKYAKDNKIPFEALSSEAIAEKEKKSTAKAKVKKEEEKEKLVRVMIRKIGECTTKPVIKNKNFVLTFLSSEQEEKITSYITQKGGFVRSSTVLDTDYIIIADGNWNGESAKSKRALELNTTRGKNIKALTETDFWRFMGKDEYDEDEYDEDEYDEDVYDEDEYDEDYSLNADVEDEDDDDEYITVAEAIEKLSAIEEGIKALAAEAEAMAKEAEKREKEEKKKAQANKPKKKSKKTDFYIEDGELRAYHGNAEVVVIPDGVRVIAEYGLSEAEFVTEIIISESVEIIRDEAFVGTSITSIEIPASVKEIGEGVFNFCELLENISVSENSENYCSVKGALYTKDKKKLIAFPEVITQEKQETPSFVTEIGGFAFGRVNNIKELTITDNVVNLSENSFSNINSLEKVVFGKNVKSVPENAFNRDWKLEKVVLNDGLEFIGKEAFAFCDIKEITIPGTVETIGEKAFENNRPLEKVIINEGVKSIGSRSFASCGELKEVHLPKSLEKIRANTFQSTRSLKTIYIPEDSPAIESVRKLAEKAGVTLVEKSSVDVSAVNASPKPTTYSSNVTKTAEVKRATTPTVKTEPTNQKIPVPSPSTSNEEKTNKGGLLKKIFFFILAIIVIAIIGVIAWVVFENVFYLITTIIGFLLVIFIGGRRR